MSANSRDIEYDPLCRQECIALTRLEGKMDTEFAAIRPDLKVALDGVSNFRKHAERANTYFDKAEAVFQADEKRRANAWKRWAVIIVALVCIFAYPVERLWHLVADVVSLTEEWKSYTPAPALPVPYLDKQPDPKIQHKSSFFDRGAHPRAGVEFRQESTQDANKRF